MLNQRASIISVHSHSNPSLIYHKNLNRKKKIKITHSPFDYFELLNLNEVDKKILNLLKQYLFKRKLILASSFLIILLISLNSIFLLILLQDCHRFNLCSIDNDYNSFFFWFFLGLHFSFLTLLVFIILHVFLIKQYYAQKLIKLSEKELKNRHFLNDATSSETVVCIHSENSLNNYTELKQFKKVRLNEKSNLSKLPEISIENVDEQQRSHRMLNKSYCNKNFESDSIELSELSLNSKVSTSTKEDSF